MELQKKAKDISRATKLYSGARLHPEQATASDTKVLVFDMAGRKVLTPKRSLKIRNHSPDGFSWGYGGSGCAQLALAILLDWSDDIELAQRHYQAFKWEFVSQWGDFWDIYSDEIQEFIDKEESNGNLR